ncbi:lamin tail domain-containing protein [Methanosarcina barkeri]|uniref:lamin tail domain-containing protein n=1 Tax=Methanosarcina barkeri TaxID=2208 RepID=UPI000699F9DC|nr:lamin tail domain-containing protein [Methanosarcina barkeri]
MDTIPFALGATEKTSGSTSSVYISYLDVGAPKEKPYQEYVKVTNKGSKSVNLKGWKIKDKGAKHTYTFYSYTLKSKASVVLRSGKGKNSGSTLYWNKYSFIWNNEGDTAYLYNAHGKLVSKRNG